MTDSLIQLDNVSKAYGTKPVIDAISFQVNRGEIVGLLGPNGSGKTTAIRLMTGVIMPQSGAITVAGHNPSRNGDAIRRMSGILTESAGFYAGMTGLDNLRFFAQLYGVQDPQRAQALLAEFGLGPHANQKVGTYSTGMKKRLGLAKALLHRPDILFLDEPTNGLDPEGIRMVLASIRSLNQRDGTTIILCSHLLQQLETVCHRYLFLQPSARGAHLIEQGTLPELEAKYGGDAVLHVETNLSLVGTHYGDVPAQRIATDRIQFSLSGKAAVAPLLRQILQEADVYSAVLANTDLESLYFKIREGTTHE
jgi:ABC-2 type transport system ATP-binding protein